MNLLLFVGAFPPVAYGEIHHPTGALAGSLFGNLYKAVRHIPCLRVLRIHATGVTRYTQGVLARRWRWGQLCRHRSRTGCGRVALLPTTALPQHSQPLGAAKRWQEPWAGQGPRSPTAPEE